MEVFVQQLINGLTLGSIYGLIAIGYTMVFGIIGMVNFAHGDVFMVSSFIGLVALLLLTTWIGIGSVALALVIVLIVDGARYGSFDAVIQRETTRTKFSPRLPDDDRHLSRLTWSSTRWRDPSDPPFAFPFALSAPFSETSK